LQLSPNLHLVTFAPPASRRGLCALESPGLTSTAFEGEGAWRSGHNKSGPMSHRAALTLSDILAPSV